MFNVKYYAKDLDPKKVEDPNRTIEYFIELTNLDDLSSIVNKNYSLSNLGKFVSRRYSEELSHIKLPFNNYEDRKKGLRKLTLNEELLLSNALSTGNY
ncbi:MAG: hypothetical protein ACP5N1_02905 [Candidatus Woesearchaeota archaeon]